MPHSYKSALEEVTHYFRAATTVPLQGKCSQRSPSFISLNRWKAEGARSRLHGFYMDPDMEPAIILQCSNTHVSMLCLKWFTVR